MTSRDFVYWFQGFLEISQPETMTKEQIQVVQSHLAMVFKHEIDPSMGDEKHQEVLNAAHTPAKPNNTFNPVSPELFRC